MTERLQVQVPAGAEGEFSSSGSTFCDADLYFNVHSTPGFPQQHVKDPSYSAKSALVAGETEWLNMHAHDVTE